MHACTNSVSSSLAWKKDNCINNFQCQTNAQVSTDAEYPLPQISNGNR